MSNFKNKIVLFIPMLIVFLWLFVHQLFLNNLSEITMGNFNLASESGMNAGQASWLSTNFLLTNQTTFSHPSYFTLFAFTLMILYFVFATKPLLDRIKNLESEIKELKEKLND